MNCLVKASDKSQSWRSLSEFAKIGETLQDISSGNLAVFIRLTITLPDWIDHEMWLIIKNMAAAWKKDKNEWLKLFWYMMWGSVWGSVWIFCTKYGWYVMFFDQLNYNIFHLNFIFLGQKFIGHSVWWYLIFSHTGTDFATDGPTAFGKYWALSYWISCIWAATVQSRQDGICAQRRLRSAWAFRSHADVQADLNLCWVHSHFVGFVMRWLICFVFFS